ncbi:Hypothetical predicted protein [Mytilus galloprovincialis]|uniref:RING-type domain-containing protein n=1 Tax=Mytilus galloprovincialis TaxID=29158 RepID=A0A8B6C974_MYTGA|nr:Hypothetical predicted protein [Mytilus galloprovincialis]
MIKLNSTGKKGMLCSSTVQIAFLLHMLSYGTDGWANNANEYQGLWNFCNNTGKYSCCQSLNSFIPYDEFSIPTWLTVVRVIQSLGVISSCASLVLIFLYTILEKTANVKICKVSSIILCSVTGGLILLGSTIYGSSYRYEEWLVSYFLDFSFGLSITSGVLYIIGAIFVAVFTLDKIQVRNVQPSCPDLPSPGPTTGYQVAVLRHSDPRNCQQDDRISCKICLDAEINVQFDPCSHAVVCRPCASRLKICPVCRANIVTLRQFYLG